MFGINKSTIKTGAMSAFWVAVGVVVVAPIVQTYYTKIKSALGVSA